MRSLFNTACLPFLSRVTFLRPNHHRIVSCCRVSVTAAASARGCSFNADDHPHDHHQALWKRSNTKRSHILHVLSSSSSSKYSSALAAVPQTASSIAATTLTLTLTTEMVMAFTIVVTLFTIALIATSVLVMTRLLLRASKKEGFLLSDSPSAAAASPSASVVWISRRELMNEPGVIAYFMQMSAMDCFARLPDADPFVRSVSQQLQLLSRDVGPEIDGKQLNDARHRVMTSYANKVVDPSVVQEAMNGAVDAYIRGCAQKAERLIETSAEPWSRLLSQKTLGPWRIAALRRNGGEASDAAENGYPHTFGSTVCLTLFGASDDDVIVRKDPGLVKTLVHERVHVLQRAREAWVDSWISARYKCVQVGPFDDVLPESLRWRRRSNPDLDGVLWRCGDGRTADGRHHDEKVQVFEIDPPPRSLRDSFVMDVEEAEDGRALPIDDESHGAAEHPYERMAYALADEIADSS